MVSPDTFQTFLLEFGKFREENQRQHGELASTVTTLEAQVRQNTSTLKYWIGGAAIAGLSATGITQVIM